jgi:hypothetical protein
MWYHMAPNWIRSSLRDRRDRVDPEEYAMALFSVRGDREHTRALADDLRGEAEDWRELARRARERR